MAVEKFPSMKRKRKLDVNERVEVRSLEEGFLGSWHPGTVIQCGKLKRHVRYDNLLDDGGVNHLVDEVIVSRALDDDSDSLNCNTRGLIRPLPSLIEFKGCELKFGLCVDVDHQEAWWEGVIFDNCDEKEERSVFFPDLGDEMKIGVHQMRITHDWNEVTGKWRWRGKWVFLELLEECERSSLVAVSAKQVWYDVRVSKDFDKIRDWTFNEKGLWRDLVMEVVRGYLTLTLEEIYSFLDLPRILFKETLELVSIEESVEPTPNVDLNQEVVMATSLYVANSGGQLSSSGNTNAHCDGTLNNAFGSNNGTAEIPMKKGESSYLLDIDPLVDDESDMHIMADLSMSFSRKEILVQKKPVPPVQEVLTRFQKEISCHGAGEVISDARCFKKIGKHRYATRHWESLRLSEVELCPDAVEQYVLHFNNVTIRKRLKEKVYKHLAYLGWEIEWTERECGVRDFRFTTPDKQMVYLSLIQVCKFVLNNSDMNSLVSQHDHSMTQPIADNHLSHVLLDQPDQSKDLDISPPIVPPPSVEVADKPQFCPQAVLNYHLKYHLKNWKDNKKCRLEASKHLLAKGWTIVSQDPNNKRRGMLYTSPENKKFHTLHAACGFCVEKSIPKPVLCMKPLNVPDIKDENVDQICSGDLLHRETQLSPKEPDLHATDGVAASRSTQNWKRKCLKNSKASLPKRQRNGLPLRVLRSNKRGQKVSAPCLSHQKPLNVLSWLIDSNIVLPRSKVYYQSKGRPLAEGRITRDGIRCSCCQKTYSLAGFENHAISSSTHKPATSIILEDGRSLLEWQTQIMKDSRTREAMGKATNDLFQGENDYICSVCRYGGDLILCDHCPSSFHKTCLGLEDIPDSEWFCPSCRCAMCGQSKIERTEDGHFLTCIQCEHKYHVRCLTDRYVAKWRRHPRNWLCGKDCEKIYVSLHKLLGEPVALGVDNLTWTLVKCINSDSCGLSSTEDYLLAESYIKLNIALSVMHECFEPLKEPSSSRDLMEDVLFSRWSKLSRLNFQGFYTVLLERNEELISVAIVRVYGKKVAEIPLVGTRLQYRRHGMCRILMNELEKKLMQLGVERLVLPAVPSVLETWTGSFGFVKMTDFERSQFLDNTFLDFQGTVMCQKLLSPHSVLLTESQQKPHDVLPRSCTINFDKPSPSPISEVCQAEDLDKRGMLDLQMGDTCAGNNGHCCGNDAIDSVAMVNQPISEDQQCQNNTNPQISLAKQADSYNGFKCYTRKKFTKAMGM